MCGRINSEKTEALTSLFSALGVDVDESKHHDPETRPIFKRFIGAASTLSIIKGSNNNRGVKNAIWWLLLEKTESGFKPSRYTSFNTRYDKLNVPRSAGFKAFRETRCIIPVTGFGETQGSGKDAKYTDFIPVEGAVALGGLYREWFHPKTNQKTTSCSVITLPPNDKLMKYHTKASPLILPQIGDWIETWLDQSIIEQDCFLPLLNPQLNHDFYAQTIDKPSSYNALGEPELIKRD